MTPRRRPLTAERVTYEVACTTPGCIELMLDGDTACRRCRERVDNPPRRPLCPGCKGPVTHAQLLQDGGCPRCVNAALWWSP